MVELDEQVGAVWQTLLMGNGNALAERILNFQLTPDALTEVLSQRGCSVEELAFQTILKSRTFHGGILAAGSAPLKYGENGKGIASRWYPQTLHRRILDIVEIQKRFTFIPGDGIEIMETNALRPDVVFFIDPPYTAAGKKAGRRLDTHFDLDHEALFKAASAAAGDFLMTYDNSDGVRDLAKKFNFDVEWVAMKNTHHAELTELLIGRDLSWARPTSRRK